MKEPSPLPRDSQQLTVLRDPVGRRGHVVASSVRDIGRMKEGSFAAAALPASKREMVGLGGRMRCGIGMSRCESSW